MMASSILESLALSSLKGQPCQDSFLLANGMNPQFTNTEPEVEKVHGFTWL